MKNKFRAKGARSNEWIYGAYLKMLPYTPAPLGASEPLESEYKHLIITEGFSDWNMPRGIEAFDVLSETVGQCTGLKDKNGKFIYDNDILKDTLGNIFQITYIDYGYWLHEIKTHNWRPLNTKLECYEVIGNIYDNKELLEI